MQAAARETGQEIVILNASTPSEIDTAFAALVQRAAGALIVAGDPMLAAQRDQIAALSHRHAIPTLSTNIESSTPDALITYGSSLTETYRQVGIYTGKILAGQALLAAARVPARGQAAAPPSSVINSRRLMGFPQAEDFRP